MKACAITGHRPGRFRWKGNEDSADCKRLKRRLWEQLVFLYERGVRCFYVGGAQGVDQWAGVCLLWMKKQQEYADVELMVALPFEGHDAGWDEQSRRRLRALTAQSTETVVVVGKGEPPTACYRKRNYYMVDHADCLLAVYDNSRNLRSGTGMTVNYARRKGLPILLLHPDTAVVTAERAPQWFV